METILRTMDSETSSRFIHLCGQNQFVDFCTKMQLLVAEHNYNMLNECPRISNKIKKSYEKKDALKISSMKKLEEVISTFSGDDNTSIKQWLYKYEFIANVCCWSDLQRVMYCKRMLRGSARTFVRLEKRCFSWKELQSSLRTKFSTIDTADITTRLNNTLRINEINREVNDQIRKTRKSALERFFQKKGNNSENSFVLKNTTTIKQLTEDVAYNDSINMMKDLKLQENAFRKK